MKYLREKYWFVIALLLVSCHFQPNKATDHSNEYSLGKSDLKDNNTAEIQLIDSAVFNFGNLTAGDTVIHTFRFRNVGKTPLIISSATASCGCTVAKYSKYPIAPYQIDSIVAQFNSTRQMLGFQNKVVTVNYNSPKSPELLTIYGRFH